MHWYNLGTKLCKDLLIILVNGHESYFRYLHTLHMRTWISSSQQESVSLFMEMEVLGVILWNKPLKFCTSFSVSSCEPCIKTCIIVWYGQSSLYSAEQFCVSCRAKWIISHTLLCWPDINWLLKEIRYWELNSGVPTQAAHAIWAILSSSVLHRADRHSSLGTHKPCHFYSRAATRHQNGQQTILLSQKAIGTCVWVILIDM